MDDEIVLRPSEVSLNVRVREVLASRMADQGRRIEVLVTGAMVVLRGTVHSWACRK